MGVKGCHDFIVGAVAPVQVGERPDVLWAGPQCLSDCARCCIRNVHALTAVKTRRGRLLCDGAMGNKWSQEVTRHSAALDLEPGVFTWKDPTRIARSLKRSAEQSTRRKGSPLQSAMSMLNFYINRAGRNLPEADRKRLEQAKVELRLLFRARDDER